MAVIYDSIAISSHQHASLGTLLGSRVSSDVFDAINSRGHSSFFGKEYEELSRDFADRYVKPMDRLNLELSRTVNALINPDRVRILESIEDFRSIPLSMEMAIELYDPVRQLGEEGRLDLFGYDPASLPKEDYYGRLIDNFRCNDVEAVSDDKGYFSIQGTTYSDDPDLSDDDLWAIRKTREYILNKILAETDLDPTCIDLTRG